MEESPKFPQGASVWRRAELFFHGISLYSSYDKQETLKKTRNEIALKSLGKCFSFSLSSTWIPVLTKNWYIFGLEWRLSWLQGKKLPSFPKFDVASAKWQQDFNTIYARVLGDSFSKRPRNGPKSLVSVSSWSLNLDQKKSLSSLALENVKNVKFSQILRLFSQFFL